MAATFAVVDPATEDEFGEAPDHGPDDARAAVDAAAAALPGWAGTAPRQRAEVLRRCHELLVEHADELARLITLENGKPIAEAKGEITYSAEFFRWYSGRRAASRARS
jgi:succinate-semialdehyde dehydrogenase/glutarate-semialdehyde dehydrogenase